MDDEESLECPVCMETYNSLTHNPKMMSCLHTICAICIIDLVSGESERAMVQALAREEKEPTIPKGKYFTCPMCREDILTDRVQTNRYILAHLRDLERLQGSKANSQEDSSQNEIDGDQGDRDHLQYRNLEASVSTTPARHSGTDPGKPHVEPVMEEVVIVRHQDRWHRARRHLRAPVPPPGIPSPPRIIHLRHRPHRKAPDPRYIRLDNAKYSLPSHNNILSETMGVIDSPDSVQNARPMPPSGLINSSTGCDTSFPHNQPPTPVPDHQFQKPLNTIPSPEKASRRHKRSHRLIYSPLMDKHPSPTNQPTTPVAGNPIIYPKLPPATTFHQRNPVQDQRAVMKVIGSGTPPIPEDVTDMSNKGACALPEENGAKLNTNEMWCRTCEQPGKPECRGHELVPLLSDEEVDWVQSQRKFMDGQVEQARDPVQLSEAMNRASLDPKGNISPGAKGGKGDEVYTRTKVPNMSHWSYAEIRDAVNTSCDPELLMACYKELDLRRIEFHRTKKKMTMVRGVFKKIQSY